MNLDAKIEGILYWKGEAISKKKLAQILNIKEEEIISNEEIKKTYTDAMNEISKIKKQYNGIVKFG